MMHHMEHTPTPKQLHDAGYAWSYAHEHGQTPVTPTAGHYEETHEGLTFVPTRDPWANDPDRTTRKEAPTC